VKEGEKDHGFSSTRIYAFAFKEDAEKRENLKGYIL